MWTVGFAVRFLGSVKKKTKREYSRFVASRRRKTFFKVWCRFMFQISRWRAARSRSVNGATGELRKWAAFMASTTVPCWRHSPIISALRATGPTLNWVIKSYIKHGFAGWHFRKTILITWLRIYGYKFKFSFILKFFRFIRYYTL